MVTSQTVALKIFGGDAGLAGDGKRRDRLLREARAASRSRHPHVLAIDDLLDLEDGRAALVMPLLTGQSLRDRLAHDGKLSVDVVRALFAPALEGLERAHEAGIVHRDLKPDNLFVTRDPPRLVILDFGVAKIAADGDLGLTSTGVTVGTPFYMAPEQLFGEDDVDARADIWALGVVLFECLVGERPTEAGNLGQLLKRVSAGKVGRLLPEDAPDAPALVAIVNAMLSVERDARPTLADLRAVLTAPIAPPVAILASSPPVAALPTRALPPVRSRQGPLLLAGLFVALVGTAVIAGAPTFGRPGQRAASSSVAEVAASVAASTSVSDAPAPSSTATPVSSLDPRGSVRPAPSGTTSALRVASSAAQGLIATATTSASAKFVAAAPVPAVSSSPVPPRIVEQAPF